MRMQPRRGWQRESSPGVMPAACVQSQQRPGQRAGLKMTEGVRVVEHMSWGVAHGSGQDVFTYTDMHTAIHACVTNAHALVQMRTSSQTRRGMHTHPPTHPARPPTHTVTGRGPEVAF